MNIEDVKVGERYITDDGQSFICKSKDTSLIHDEVWAVGDDVVYHNPRFIHPAEEK